MGYVVNTRRQRIRRKRDGLDNIRAVPADVARRVLAQFRQTTISPETLGANRIAKRRPA